MDRELTLIVDDESESELPTWLPKISVIPDIRMGAAMDGGDFHCDLAPHEEQCLQELREMWNAYKRTPAIQHKLKLLFMRHEKPLLLALKLFALSPGCNNLKNKNLASFILETICDLHKEQPAINLTCDDNSRLVAFNFLKTCGVSMLCKAVLETYELFKVRDLLVPKLRELVAKGHYKDAAYWAMHLKLTKLFGVLELVFPLILQEKVFMAEEYLCVAKEQQLPTVQFLDSLLTKEKTVFNHCSDILDEYKYVNIKHDVLSYRPMSKLVTRLVKRYKIDTVHTPNLTYTKACSYLHYLYHKYVDGGMSTESFRELVHDAASSPALQLDLVNKIDSFHDLEEAVYWAKHFRVPVASCPPAVQVELKRTMKDRAGGLKVSFADDDNLAVGANRQNSGGCGGDGGGGGGDRLDTGADNFRMYRAREKKFLTLQLSGDCIFFVDHEREFLAMLAYLERHSMVAFDSEWKPSVCNDNVVSLLQLATLERVYLVDCQALPLSAELWRLLGRKIFNNYDILKIGFSLHQDLHMLHKSLPLQLNTQSGGYLDLRDLWRRLKYLQLVDYPYGRCTNTAESLTALTKLCLGKKLDKSNQFSNWANRPLRGDQIQYAALDAHCLVLIYNVMGEIFHQMGIDVDNVVEELTTTRPGSLFRIRRSTNPTDQDHSHMANGHPDGLADNDPTRSVSVLDIRFVCDIMLYGLSKELRKLGIDCVDVNNDQVDIKYYVDLAKTEKRYILSKDMRHTMFASKLSARQCMYICEDATIDQLRNVLHHYRISVHARNLFTRCLQCNSNEFILALRDQMVLMRFGQLHDGRDRYNRGKIGSGKSGNYPCYAKHIDPRDRTCSLLSVNDHVMRNKTTYCGAAIKLNRLKPHILNNKNHFFICDNCGVCTWDGAHPLHNSILELIAGLQSSDNVSAPNRNKPAVAAKEKGV